MSISNNVGHHNYATVSEMLKRLQEQINEVQPFLIANKEDKEEEIPISIPILGGSSSKRNTVSRRNISKSIVINLKNKKNNTKKNTMKKIKIGKRIIINISK
jgi:hypothetical protein